jgi:plasmid stabilization system protein ParE
MASSKPKLTVILSPTAEGELWGIWIHNLETYKSLEHADSYLDFLREGINGLTSRYDEGREVEDLPELRSIALRKSRRGYGHIVIFEIDAPNETVYIHHVFHTSQDILGRLKADSN